MKVLKEFGRMMWNFSEALMILFVVHDLLALFFNKTFWFNWN